MTRQAIDQDVAISVCETSQMLPELTVSGAAKTQKKTANKPALALTILSATKRSSAIV